MKHLLTNRAMTTQRIRADRYLQDTNKLDNSDNTTIL